MTQKIPKPETPQPETPKKETEDKIPRSVHTSNFPKILKDLGISLAISTYQAGKVIMLRENQGKLNTHFRLFKEPMGLAVKPGRMALGTKYEVREFRNMPAVAKELEPVGKHDACYVTHTIQMTGDIDVHEMAWANNQLWIVNTRFSCLCTLDNENNFVPRWKPKFIQALTPNDQCHLNGLGIVGDRPKYVTALGATDTKAGWRENKANGGILIDVASNAIVMSGLSMPHSPRWWRDRLWLLESGKGSLAIADLKAGKLQTVINLPGFTRGIDFYGNLAFIGLSQVRETATFSGIPIVEKMDERNCGVWVVDLNSGKTIAFMKFEQGVQEIFSVQVLPNIRFPEIIDEDREMAEKYEEILCNYFSFSPRILAQINHIDSPEVS